MIKQKQLILKKLHKILILNVLCIFCFSLSGCASFKKKFIRPKKKKTDYSKAFKPVLEPIDYGVKQYSSKERYQKHYALYKVWNKEALRIVKDGKNEKRVRYLLSNMIVQLEEMGQWLKTHSQQELEVLIEELRKIERSFKKPERMRNLVLIKNKMERNAKKLRSSFSSTLELDYK